MDWQRMGWQRVLDWQRVRRAGARVLRKPRLARAHLLAGLLLGLLGFSLVAQAQQTQSEDLSSLNQSELVKILDTLTNRSQRLEAQARELRQTSEDLRTGSDRAAAAERATRARLEVLGILAGTLPAHGEGITLRIDDPQVKVDAADLLDTVQELRDAGAEALQLGTVRVVASTSFVDESGAGGNGGAGAVVVDGAALTAPFTFTAIGDPATLGTALDIPGGVLETLRQDGARGTVRTVDDLSVTALHEVRQPRFAVPNTGG
jgi:uncharacterized protein YlxW (UPF0749 family)